MIHQNAKLQPLPSAIRKIFDGFTKVKALVIGDVMLDTYLFGSVSRISPEAPVPIVNIEKTESRLGGAANVPKLQFRGGLPAC